MSLLAQKTRLSNIDGLRALAIALVLVTHTWVYFGAPALSFVISGRQITLASLPAIGHVGVNLFLVISGFSLAWPFMRNHVARSEYDVRDFFKRRVARIFPPYYASIVVVYAIALCGDERISAIASGHKHFTPTAFASLESLEKLWPHLLLVHNLFPAHVSTINGSYWSLALEFQLYLFFPLFLASMQRWGMLKLVCCVAFTQLAYRIGLEIMFTPAFLAKHEFVLPKAAPGRMFDFVLGMVAARIVAEQSNPVNRFVREQRSTVMFTFLWLGMTFTAATSHAFPLSIIDVLWACGFSGLVVVTSLRHGLFSRVLCWRPFVGLGGRLIQRLPAPSTTDRAGWSSNAPAIAPRSCVSCRAGFASSDHWCLSRLFLSDRTSLLASCAAECRDRSTAAQSEYSSLRGI